MEILFKMSGLVYYQNHLIDVCNIKKKTITIMTNNNKMFNKSFDSAESVLFTKF